MSRTRKTNIQKELRKSVEKFSGDIESLSSQIANLTDAIISEKNLAASKIKSERELLARKTALQNIKEDIDDIRSERRKNQDKLDRLISEQEKEAEKEKGEKRKKETQYSDLAKKSFEDGQFISGMFFKFLGRNEKDKKQIEAERKADRQDQIQDLTNRSKELAEQTKSLKDIRNSINYVNTNILDIEEERKYEANDAENKTTEVTISDFISVKLIDIEDIVLSKLQKTIKTSIKESGISSGSGLPSIIPDLPFPIPSGTAGTASKMTKLARFGKVVGKFALPLAIADGIYSFATGLSDETVTKTLGKKHGEKITGSDKSRSAFANLKSGLTFNLIPPEFFAKTDVLDPILGPYSPIGLLSSWFLDGELLTSLKTLTNTISNWFGMKPKPGTQDTGAGAAGAPKVPIEKLQNEMDPDLIAAIQKEFAGDPNTIESVKRLAFSESGGKNKKSGLTGTDYGYFQFNRAYAVANAKKAGFDIEQPEDIMDLSAEQQTKIYAEYIKNLRQAKIPLTPENLKIYGFASGTGLEALKTQAVKGEEVAGKSIIYSKKWLDEKTKTKEGKRNFAHFIEMSKLDSESGGAVTLKGMQSWIRTQKSELSTQQPSAAAAPTKLSASPTPSTAAGAPAAQTNTTEQQARLDMRFKEINTSLNDAGLREKYPILYNEMLNEMKNPQTADQTIGGGTNKISPEARMRLRAMYEQKTRKSSSVQGLSYRDLNTAVKEEQTQSTSPTAMNTLGENRNGSATYSAAAYNRDISQQTKGDNNILVSSNSSVVTTTQNGKSSRKELRDTYNPLREIIRSA